MYILIKKLAMDFFDLLGTFNIISSSFRNDKGIELNNNFIEYYVNKLFMRIPKYKMEELKWKKI